MKTPLSTLSIFYRLRAAIAAALFLPFIDTSAQPLTIETVPVHDIWNPGDFFNPWGDSDIGRVGYSYRIGKFEVTNSQYAYFLNQVAARDDYGLYYFGMAGNHAGVGGGITRSGTPGSYSYTVRPGYENKPVGFVSYWDCARFANWLATGYTEGRPDAASPLLPGAAYDTGFKANPPPSAGTRLPGASVFLPSKNEWYKAAYYQPPITGGDVDGYWAYATRSNTQPYSAVPAPAANSANYFFDDLIDNGVNAGYAVTQSTQFEYVEYYTNVGSYGAASESYYGTADQNGNVLEWTEDTYGPSRRLEGGDYNDSAYVLSAWGGSNPASTNTDSGNYGFRIASLIQISTVISNDYFSLNPVQFTTNGSIVSVSFVTRPGSHFSVYRAQSSQSADWAPVLFADGSQVIVGDGATATRSFLQVSPTEVYQVRFVPAPDQMGVEKLQIDGSESVITLRSQFGIQTQLEYSLDLINWTAGSEFTEGNGSAMIFRIPKPAETFFVRGVYR